MQKKIIDNTSSKIPALYKIKDVETLKSFGSYTEAKIWVEEKVGVALKINGWNQLLKRIHELSFSVNENIEKLIFLLDEKEHLKELGSFPDAKKKVSALLGFQIKVRSWKQLERSLKSIVVAFRNRDMIDKAAIFEKNKIQNFIHSSRLEGIPMTDAPALKMADIIEQYRVKQ
ncbi:MAG: YhfG family protein [Methylobacter sp.]|jgi:hypothetical protein|nr:YhfG family protein [Methylobacter sp.]